MALANKYRPKSFSEVIGQDNAVLALRNIIKNKNFHNLRHFLQFCVRNHKFFN